MQAADAQVHDVLVGGLGLGDEGRDARVDGLRQDGLRLVFAHQHLACDARVRGAPELGLLADQGEAVGRDFVFLPERPALDAGGVDEEGFDVGHDAFVRLQTLFCRGEESVVVFSVEAVDWVASGDDLGLEALESIEHAGHESVALAFPDLRVKGLGDETGQILYCPRIHGEVHLEHVRQFHQLL